MAPGRPAVSDELLNPEAVMNNAADLLEELVGRDLLAPEEVAGDELSQERAQALGADLRIAAAQLKRFIEQTIAEMHPLVSCPDCGETQTACDAGNRYCASCGETLDGAPGPEGSESNPWCWCGHAQSRHRDGICFSCKDDSAEDDEADPLHEFQDAKVGRP